MQDDGVGVIVELLAERMIYRPGAITADQIRSVAGPVELLQEKIVPDAAAREALPSPSVGLRETTHHVPPHPHRGFSRRTPRSPR